MNSNKADLRIVVSSSKEAESIAKSINNFNFEENYNIIISSIIPTFNPEIVKNVSKGADIILIGAYDNNEYHILFNELKNEFNHIELLNFSNIDFSKVSTIEDEIKNSIIKAGLSFSLTNINSASYQNKIDEISSKYNELQINFNDLTEENTKLKQENVDLTSDIGQLNTNLDEVKSEFSNFKSRFEDIYSKKILEIYNLNDLLFEIFNTDTIEEEKIIIATNKFKPEDVIVGQGLIGAKSKEIAIDWLKIVKTALIFLENSEDDLKEELTKSETPTSEIKEEVKENYDIPNNFENFWE